MDTFKEFEGKSLDDAIRDACAYFDLPREKLEIDIVRDAKSGIFGLVGTRKAVIRAQRAQVAAKVGDILGSPLREPRPVQPQKEAPAAKARTEQDEAKTHEQRRKPRPAGREQSREGQREQTRDDRDRSPVQTREAVQEPVREQTSEDRPPARPRPGNAPGRRPRQEETTETFSRADTEFDLGDEHEHERAAPIESLDQDLLRSLVTDTASRLILPIVHDARLDVEIGKGRVAVHIASDEDLGLLIGREGQTLACLQYLSARIVARRMGSPVRLQLDAGDYRERQDEKLRDLALMLAERAKTTGRVCPTRPLSSYQRRIVHMTLQDDPSIQTRSAGEGPLKRVVIQRARTEQ